MLAVEGVGELLELVPLQALPNSNIRRRDAERLEQHGERRLGDLLLLLSPFRPGTVLELGQVSQRSDDEILSSPLSSKTARMSCSKSTPTASLSASPDGTLPRHGPWLATDRRRDRRWRAGVPSYRRLDREGLPEL